MLIEKILHKAKDLHVLVDLVGAMQIDHPIGRHLRILVGLIANQVLAANGVQVRAHFPNVFKADFETLLRNRRDAEPRKAEIRDCKRASYLEVIVHTEANNIILRMPCERGAEQGYRCVARI